MLRYSSLLLFFSIIFGLHTINGMHIEERITSSHELLREFHESIERTSVITRLHAWWNKKEPFNVDDDNYLIPYFSQKNKAALCAGGTIEVSNGPSTSVAHNPTIIVGGPIDNAQKILSNFFRIIKPANMNELSLDESIIKHSICRNLIDFRVNDIVFQGDTKQPVLKLMHGNENSKRALVQALFGFKTIYQLEGMAIVNGLELEDSTQNYCGRIEGLTPPSFSNDTYEENARNYYEKMSELFKDLWCGGSPRVILGGLEKATIILKKLKGNAEIAKLSAIFDKMQVANRYKSNIVLYNKLSLVLILTTCLLVGAYRGPETYYDVAVKTGGFISLFSILSGISFLQCKRRLRNLENQKNEILEPKSSNSTISTDLLALQAFIAVRDFHETWKWAKSEPLS